MTKNQKQLIKNAIQPNINFIVNKNFEGYRKFVLQCIKSYPKFTQEMAINIYKVQFVNL